MFPARSSICAAAVATMVLCGAPASAAVLTFSFVAEPFTNPECGGATASDYCGGYATGSFSIDEALYGGSLAGTTFMTEFYSPLYFVSPTGFVGDAGLVSASPIDIFSLSFPDPFEARALPTLWEVTMGDDYELLDIGFEVYDDYPDIMVGLSEATLRVYSDFLDGEEFLTAPVAWTVTGAPGPVVPLPAGAPLLALGLGALALVKRRRA